MLMCCPKKSQSKEALPARPSPLPPLLPKSSTTFAEPEHERRAMTVSTAPSAATPPSATSKRLGRGHRSGWNVSKGRSCHDLFVDLVVHEYGRSIALLGGPFHTVGGPLSSDRWGSGFGLAQRTTMLNLWKHRMFRVQWLPQSLAFRCARGPCSKDASRKRMPQGHPAILAVLTNAGRHPPLIQYHERHVKEQFCHHVRIILYHPPRAAAD